MKDKPIPLPSTDANTLEEVLASTRHIKDTRGNKATEAAKVWLHNITVPSILVTGHSILLDEYKKNKPTHEINEPTKVQPFRQVPKVDTSPDTVLSVDQVSRLLRSKVNISGREVVYLPATGIWVTISAPVNADWIMLDTSIAKARNGVGYNLYGIPFTASNVFMFDIIANWCLNFVVGTNAKTTEEWDPISLDTIKYQDFDLIFNTILATRYPKGMPYTMACPHDPAKCNHVEEETILLRKLDHVFTDKLTDKQKSLLTKIRPNSIAEDDYKDYQKEFKEITDTIELAEDFSIQIVYRDPTAGEYIDHGVNWLQGLIDDVETLPGLEEDDRIETVKRMADSVSLMDRGAVIKSIVINGMGEANTPETINTALTDLSEDEEAVKLITKSIDRFTRKNIYSGLAVYAYKCPSCGKGPKDDNNLVPIEGLALFIQRLVNMTL